MAWRLPGDKPLSEPMMVSLLTHICIIRPQWVKRHCMKFSASLVQSAERPVDTRETDNKSVGLGFVVFTMFVHTSCCTNGNTDIEFQCQDAHLMSNL